MSSKSGQEMAQFHNLETKLQYKETNPMPFLVEKHMLNEKVGDVKLGLLSLDMLSFVTEKPDQLKLCLVLPPECGIQQNTLQPMDDDRKLIEYLTELSRCEKLKLLKHTDMGVKAVTN